MTRTLAIGVDIGGTRTKSGLVDVDSGSVLHSIVQPTATNDEELFINQIGKVIAECRKIADQSNQPLTSIGIGVPGFTRKNGFVDTTYGFLKFMDEYPLGTIIEEKFSLACMIDNDARAVALGEAIYGKGKNFDRVLSLTLGTGVGFGMVVKQNFNEILPVAHMAGHMTITSGTSACYCGKTGCLEYLVSSSGIARAAQKIPGIGEGLTAPDIFDLAQQGNKNAQEIVHTIIGYLHTAIYNYTNLVAPDIIVLGGGISKSLLPYVDEIKGAGYLSSYPGYSFKLEVSDLEERAGILGSAALVRLNKNNLSNI